MEQIKYLCPCARDGEFKVKFSLTRCYEELVEFLKKPSYDELSDFVLCVSAVIHAVIPAWKWILPGGEKSMRKGVRRFKKHKCCRSYRNRCTKFF